jgi:hypothetical protein
MKNEKEKLKRKTENRLEKIKEKTNQKKRKPSVP